MSMYVLVYCTLNLCFYIDYSNIYYCLQFLVSDWKYGEKLVNATNDAEHTPLHVASERGNQEAVNILLQHGACGCSPVIVSHPERRCVDLGKEVVTFRCKATGTPPLEYSWKFNGNVLEGETKSTLTIDEVSCKDTGIYQCCVTNRFDDVTSNPAELRIGMDMTLCMVCQCTQ